MPARIELSARASRRFACLALAVGLLGLASSTHATTYQVNSPADVPDANTQTAACETAAGNGICTLRAAVQQANAHPGLDTILLPANTYVLSRVGDDDSALNGDLDITDSLTVIGSDPALTIIDGNGVVTGDRAFEISRCIGNQQDGPNCVVGPVVTSLANLAIEHGVAKYFGGGIYNQGQLTITNCLITENVATTSDTGTTAGGGIHNTGSLTLEKSVVSDNAVGGNGYYRFGGGVSSFSTLSVSDSTISGNSSAAGNGGGFAIGNGATFAIRNSTINGNTALLGGGICLCYPVTEPFSRLNLVNDTISGNSSNADGGGIYASTGSAGLYNVTVAGNLANADKVGSGGGAGIYNAGYGYGVSVTLSSSILAGNSRLIEGSLFIVLADCAGTLASTGHNIVTNATCTIDGAYSKEAPKLGPLQDNGGLTLTQALLAHSPALDAGSCTDDLGIPLATDQRGVSRPQGAACDLGAFEFEDLIFADAFEPAM